jgi:hypothetical protein
MDLTFHLSLAPQVSTKKANGLAALLPTEDTHCPLAAHSRYPLSNALLFRFLTYYPGRRINAEDGLKHEYFRETPLPIDPSMFPTWPAKSEQQRVKRGTSPRPPEGGLGYSQLVRGMTNSGSHLGVWVGSVLMMATLLHRVMMT